MNSVKGYALVHIDWMKSPRNREFAIQAFKVRFTPNLGSLARLAPGTASGFSNRLDMRHTRAGRCGATFENNHGMCSLLKRLLSHSIQEAECISINKRVIN